MAISIQHVRGSLEDWTDVNPVVPDGEIALVCEADRYRIKIGDGATQINSLPYFDRNIKKCSAGVTTIYAETDWHYIYTALITRVSISLPQTTEYQDGFRMAVTFNTTPAKTPTFQTSASVYMTGDDTANGTFTPVANRHYTVNIYYDGSFQGTVRAVPYSA